MAEILREGRNTRVIAEVAALATENAELWAEKVQLLELRGHLEAEITKLRTELREAQAAADTAKKELRERRGRAPRRRKKTA